MTQTVWGLFASTFASIFLAELGDKTQLATMSLASEGGSRWVVFAGSALALVLSSALATFAGGAVTKVVPAIWIERAAGALFIAIGIWTLWPKAA